MKYTLDTIPVLDAYKTGCECPLCQLRIACEDSYVDSMLGAAYMEPDCRVRTNEVGFCTRHFQLMYDRRNRLGLALMTHTHMQEVISSVESILKADEPARGGLLASLRGGRDEGGTPQKIRARMSGCVICEQMESAVNRYAYTIAQLYGTNSEFKAMFDASRASVCRIRRSCWKWPKRRSPARRCARSGPPSRPSSCRTFIASRASWSGSRSSSTTATPTSPGATAATRSSAPSTS